MKVLGLASAALAVGALLGAGSPAKADEITMKLGGIGSSTGFAVEPAVVNTLKLDANDSVETEQVWRRYGGYGYGGYRGGYYGGGYGGYRGYYGGGYGYGGYRGYYGGYNYYRPNYGYGYGYNNWYRPYYGYGYGYGYRNRWINDTGSSTVLSLSQPYVGVTVAKPWCADAPAVNYQQAPTLPAPQRVPPAGGGYNYDGGPTNPVPMPNGIPAVPEIPPAAEDSDAQTTVTAVYRVSAPALSKKKVATKTTGYSAYGERK